MHELGHNLGLRHGGADDRNYKANYLSVMNYAFQFRGLQQPADGTTSLDYSRFGDPARTSSSSTRPAGFGLAAGSEPARFWTIYKCPDDTLSLAELIATPLDWNCDGTASGVVASDVNRDGGLSSFTPFVDWPALIYDGGAIGAGGAQPETTALIEPGVDELLESQRALEAITPAPTPTATLGPTATPAPDATGRRRAAAGPDPRSRPPTIRRSCRSSGSCAAAPAPLRCACGRPVPGSCVSRSSAAPAGRRAGGRCVPATRRNRRARACVRFVAVGAPAVRPVAAGPNRVALGGRRLAAGRYRVVVTPLSAVRRNPGTPLRAAFRIASRQSIAQLVTSRRRIASVPAITNTAV